MRPRLRASGNIAAWAVIGIAFAASCIGACFSSQGDLASSRLATVYSLTEHRTWYIDQPDNRFANETIDKVEVRGIEESGVMRGGRLISSKPPIMPLVMTGIYLLARPLTGWDLHNADAITPLLVLMTIIMLSGSFLITLVYFDKTLGLFDLTPVVRLFLLCSLACGTQLAGYSITINNHVPGAAALMVAIYYGLGMFLQRIPRTGLHFAAFGFVGALVPTLDMPVGIYVGALGCVLFWKYPKQTLLWTLAGGVLPLAVHFSVTYAVTGSFLPVQMRESTYMYESAYWRHPLGIDALSEPKLTYLFHTTFGRCGLFSLFPVLFLGIIGVLIALRGDDAGLRACALVSFGCFLMLVAYYVKSTHNYGGESYGFRWYIASMPVLLLMAIPALRRINKPWQRGVAAILLLISCYSTGESVYVGWQSGKEWTSRIFGPAYQQVKAQE